MKGSTMKIVVVLPLAALSLLIAAAAHAQAPAPTAATSLPQAAVPATHLGVGTVRRFESAQRMVTIDHQAISSMNMPPMTMQFRVGAGVSVAELAVGQSVAFLLVPTAEGMLITSLQPIAVSARAGSGDTAAAHSMPGMKGHDMAPMSGMKMMPCCQ